MLTPENYFAAKTAKLEEQLNSKYEGVIGHTQIFDGVRIYINGYTSPPEPELRRMFVCHGGQYSQYFSVSKTTFVIATNLPYAKTKQMSAKTLKPEWITDSIKAGTRLDYQNYFLYNKSGAINKKTLIQDMSKPKSNTKHVSSLLPKSVNDDEGEDTDRNQSNDLGDIFSTAVGGTKNKSPSNSNYLKSTTEEGFLEDFYNKSRLHLISTMKKETQQLVAGWRRNAESNSFLLLDRYLLELNKSSSSVVENLMQDSNDAVIFHIDMDCFFVSVGRLSRPHLLEVPVAVTHSKGNGSIVSKSEIACVSYEGRAKGVTAGMWLDEAKGLCPELQTIPYDFEEYRRVSKIFFETVASLTLELEPISCDELYLNARQILLTSSTFPNQLATFLRTAIKESTKIDATIGIGNNKLTARIATRMAKENRNGVLHLASSDAKEIIRELPVSKLPGVGYATTDKINNVHKIKSCGELESLNLQELKSSLGEKTGEKLYWLCRGVDNDPVNCGPLHHAKSVSAGCSFGVRFSTTADLNDFIKILASELSRRAAESRCTGDKITLSLWIVRKGFINEPVKPGAHGIVDIHTRTRQLHIHTREVDIVYNMSSELSRSITQGSIPPNYIRGVRISLDNLRHESDMKRTEKTFTQKTILSAFSSINKMRNPTHKNGFENDWESESEVKLRQSLIKPHSHQDSDDESIEKSSNSQNKDFDQTTSPVKNSEPRTTVDLDDVSCSEEDQDHLDFVPNYEASDDFIDLRRKPMPYLNGFNLVDDVKSFLRGAISSNCKPNNTDGEVLETYLTDVLNGNHLKEGCELIYCIWSLISELKADSSEKNLTWLVLFLQTLKKARILIYEKYGENFCLPTTFPFTNSKDGTGWLDEDLTNGS